VIATEGMRLVRASVSTFLLDGRIDELFQRMTVSAWHCNAPHGTRPTSDQGDGGLLGGLGGLVEKLQKGGLGNAINSWIGTGQNQPVSPGQLGSALGPDVIKMLAQRSGLSEEEITQQLSQILPGVVDKLTPHGRVPTVAELSQTT
jgi:uncharacterized protein YidB (DUF937 family)